MFVLKIIRLSAKYTLQRKYRKRLLESCALHLIAKELYRQTLAFSPKLFALNIHSILWRQMNSTSCFRRKSTHTYFTCIYRVQFRLYRCAAIVNHLRAKLQRFLSTDRASYQFIQLHDEELSRTNLIYCLANIFRDT